MSNHSKRFDFIVVGAGSAGCVLANRLTENGEHQVLLIEAGPQDKSPWISRTYRLWKGLLRSQNKLDVPDQKDDLHEGP